MRHVPSSRACPATCRLLLLARRLAFLSALLPAWPPTSPFAAEREGGLGPGPADPACLIRLLERVDSLRTTEHLPLVIFDIDGTLLDPAARHAAIFRDYAERHPDDAAPIRAGLDRLPLAEYAYAPESTLARMGVRDTALVGRLKDEWTKAFFSNRYLLEDRPLPGAAAFVRRRWERGAFVVYLTGRDLPRMLEGTAASLREHGFPVAAPRVSLVLKPDPVMRDADFKGPALDALAATGVVCGVFENEPRNLNLMADRFPQAEAIFVETNHAPGAPPVRARASWIRDYEMD